MTDGGKVEVKSDNQTNKRTKEVEYYKKSKRMQKKRKIKRREKEVVSYRLKREWSKRVWQRQIELKWRGKQPQQSTAS